MFNVFLSNALCMSKHFKASLYKGASVKYSYCNLDVQKTCNNHNF